jgi:hypothetical protein
MSSHPHHNVSRLLPLCPHRARGRRAPQHYALLPPSLRTSASLVTRISDHLDSPGLNHLLFPSLYVSVPQLCSQLPHECPYVVLLPLCWRCSCLVPCLFLIKCLTPRTCFSTPAPVLTQWMFSLAKHLGKNIWAWIQAWHWSAVMLLLASSMAWRRVACSW